MLKKNSIHKQVNWSDKFDNFMVYLIFLFLMMVIGQLIRAKVNGWLQLAKRFIDTSLFSKKWIRELDVNMKLFWGYLLTKCDHAGIWDVDIELAAFQIGVDLDESKILETFNRKIIPFKSGKWFIPKFIDYQYGELNENVNAHKSVIKILNKYGLNVKNQLLPNSSATDQDIYKDKDQVKNKDKVKKIKRKNKLKRLIYLN